MCWLIVLTVLPILLLIKKTFSGFIQTFNYSWLTLDICSFQHYRYMTFQFTCVFFYILLQSTKILQVQILSLISEANFISQYLYPNTYIDPNIQKSESLASYAKPFPPMKQTIIGDFCYPFLKFAFPKGQIKTIIEMHIKWHITSNNFWLQTTTYLHVVRWCSLSGWIMWIEITLYKYHLCYKMHICFAYLKPIKICAKQNIKVLTNYHINSSENLN